MRITNANGSISISNHVIAAVAGNAATSCFGVKGMTETSVKDGIVRLLKREMMTKGVFVTTDEKGSVAIELHIAVDGGINIPAACGSIINEVKYNVENQTGLAVSGIAICVDAVKA